MVAPPRLPRAVIFACACALALAWTSVAAAAGAARYVVRVSRDRSALELVRARQGSKHGPRSMVVSASTASRLGSLRPSEFTIEPLAVPVVLHASSPTLVVRFTRDVTATDVGRVRSAASATAVRVVRVGRDRVGVLLANSSRAREVADAVASLDSVAHVASVVPFERHAVEEFVSVWSGAQQAWEAFLMTNTTVALADTGVDTEHCSFASPHAAAEYLLKDEPLVAGADAYPGTKLRAYVSVCTSMMSDGSGTCTSQTDDSDAAGGHGTAMASVLAGQPCSSSTDETELRAAERGGISSRVVFFDLLTGAGSYLRMPLNLRDMFASALAFGARTFSASWGAGCSNLYDETAIQVDSFVRANPTFLLVVSAGNCGLSGGGVASPATAKNVLSVGASMSGAGVYVDGSRHFSSADVVAHPSRYDATSVASFTSVGTRIRRVPLVTAPGVMVSAAQAGSSESFFLVSGTSPAAQVAAAIMETIRNDLRVASGTQPTAATLRAAAVALATPSQMTVVVGSSSVAPSLDDPRLRGYFGTLRPSWGNETDWTIRETSVGSFGVVSVCGTGQSTIGVAWDDEEAPLGSTHPLKNELYVVVTDADTAEVIDYDLDVDNNHKRLSVPAGRNWRLAVAADMMTAPQTFSVVAMGGTVGSCATACAVLDAPRPLPCAVDHGTGLRVCTAAGTPTCVAQACDAGYALSPTGTCEASAIAGTECAEHEVWNATCVCAGDVLCSDGTRSRCVNGVFDATPATDCLVSRSDVQQEYETVGSYSFVTHEQASTVAPFLSIAVAFVSLAGVGVLASVGKCGDHAAAPDVEAPAIDAKPPRRGSAPPPPPPPRTRWQRCVAEDETVFVAAYACQALFATVGVAVRTASPTVAYLFLLSWALCVALAMAYVPRRNMLPTAVVLLFGVVVVGLAELLTPPTPSDPLGRSWVTTMVGVLAIVGPAFARNNAQATQMYAVVLVVVGFLLAYAAISELASSGTDNAAVASVTLVVAIIVVVVGVLWYLCSPRFVDSEGGGDTPKKE